MTKTQVTQRALIQRINRALAKIDELLRYNRADGTYMRIDSKRNTLIEEYVNLGKLGKELKILKPWESTEGTK